MKNSHTFSDNILQPNNSLPRTDLACESLNLPTGTKGTLFREYSLYSIPVSELTVCNEEGENACKKRKGTYITVHAPTIRLLSDEEESMLTDALCDIITSMTERLTKKPITRETRVLVAGLGNRFISADSIGPRTADKISVTGHLMSSEKRQLFELIGCSSLCAVHPGVMGQTGIEAVAMIKGACDYVKPDVVIAVDALAARSTSRLCATIQLSDTGIEPGSGIGNRRGAVNHSTVGYPVIALGVPTVVDCATLVYDTLQSAGVDSFEENVIQAIEKKRDFFVSMRDSDTLAEEISSLLARAVNRAFFAEGL